MERWQRQVASPCWIARRRSVPASASAAVAASTPPSSRGGGGRPWASTTCRPRSRRRQRRVGVDGLSYVVGDVTRLPSAHLGTFDFFLDIGCFQGLDAGQRLSQGACVSALANPEATLLVSFGPSRRRSLVGGASQGRSTPPSRAGRCSRRAGGHRGLGLADEEDGTAVVQAAPADLERHCPVSRCQAGQADGRPGTGDLRA